MQTHGQGEARGEMRLFKCFPPECTFVQFESHPRKGSLSRSFVCLQDGHTHWRSRLRTGKIKWGDREKGVLLGVFVEKRWSNALSSCWPVGRVITCVSEQPSRETTPPFLERTNRSYGRTAVPSIATALVCCTNTTISIASSRRPWSSRSSRG